MGLRDLVKHRLRVWGYFLTGTVHERMNVLEQGIHNLAQQNNAILERTVAILERDDRRARHEAAISARLASVEQQGAAILEQNERRARNETALLQSSVFLVEALQRLQSDLGAHAADMLRSVAAQIDALWVVESPRGGRAAMIDALDALSVRTGAALQTLHEVAALSSQTRQFLDEEATRQICVEVDDYAALNPEIGLMSFLYSYLPSHKALDIGAHEGTVSDYLLQSGYEVYAFEPFPGSYERLVARLKDHPRFHPFNVALGSRQTMMTLHTAVDLSADGIHDDATAFHSLAPHAMPDDLPFQGSVLVPVRTVADLHRDNDLPGDIGLVKIDTEGFDLEVIRGMEEHRYPVVGVEFWDPRIPFGQTGLLYTVESIVGEMRERGYAWHLVLYRIWGRQHTAYYSNHNHSVPHSWGNIYFFREHDLFDHARQWCSAVLPRTYFKAQPAKEPSLMQGDFPSA
jgi:FkbM family methyltransferase